MAIDNLELNLKQAGFQHATAPGIHNSVPRKPHDDQEYLAEDGGKVLRHFHCKLCDLPVPDIDKFEALLSPMDATSVRHITRFVESSGGFAAFEGRLAGVLRLECGGCRPGSTPSLSRRTPHTHTHPHTRTFSHFCDRYHPILPFLCTLRTDGRGLTPGRTRAQPRPALTGRRLGQKTQFPACRRKLLRRHACRV